MLKMFEVYSAWNWSNILVRLKILLENPKV